MSHVRIDDVGRAYRQYHSKTGRLIKWLFLLDTKRHNLKWILSDVNLEVVPGGAVGIIGINSTGKNTLFKLITGTSRSTTGEIGVSGRVAALLELGMGFHPDFTGRQSVYMPGQLLGLSSEKVTELMLQIEEFAETGDYIDQPVCVCSSGMQVWLASSVATTTRSDMPIIDEALSVGDAYFQHKSFERIRKFRQEGATLLLVSHDKQAVQGICGRVILSNKGQIEMGGGPEVVMGYYNVLLADKQSQPIKQVEYNGKTQTVSGTGEVIVSEAHLLDEQGSVTEFVSVGHRVSLQVNVEVKDDIPEFVVGYTIKDRLEQPIFGTNTYHLDQALTSSKKREGRLFLFPFNAKLEVDSYSTVVVLHTSSMHLGKNYGWRGLAMVFNVVNTERQEFVGVSWSPPELETS